MSSFEVGTTLEDYTVIAHNYAEQSSNKMHSDGVAEQYGFEGGLVPGVAIYAYMTVPVVNALGFEWIERGEMTGKFIKPVYHEESVRVLTKVTAADPLRMTISVLNEDDVLCAVGEASLPDAHPPVHITDYPWTPMPDAKYPASIDGIPDDTPMGSINYTMDFPLQHGEFEPFLEEVKETLPIYTGDNPVIHPAYVAAKANQLLVENVDLGPWIHTASHVRHHSLPEPGEKVTLQGYTAHSYNKRGHDIAVLNLVSIGEHDQVLQNLSHTAIIKPATKSQ
jgi:acyl dehydratase